MKLTDFIQLVRNTRAAQKRYQRTPIPKYLTSAEQHEAELDRALAGEIEIELPDIEVELSVRGDGILVPTVQIVDALVDEIEITSTTTPSEGDTDDTGDRWLVVGGH